MMGARGIRWVTYPFRDYSGIFLIVRVVLLVFGVAFLWRASVEKTKQFPLLYGEEMSQENVRVYPAVLLKPEDNYDAVFDRLHAEGWSANSSEYMQANTLEEAVMLQTLFSARPTQRANSTRSLSEGNGMSLNLCVCAACLRRGKIA